MAAPEAEASTPRPPRRRSSHQPLTDCITNHSTSPSLVMETESVRSHPSRGSVRRRCSSDSSLKPLERRSNSSSSNSRSSNSGTGKYASISHRNPYSKGKITKKRRGSLTVALATSTFLTLCAAMTSSLLIRGASATSASGFPGVSDFSGSIFNGFGNGEFGRLGGGGVIGRSGGVEGGLLGRAGKGNEFGFGSSKGANGRSSLPLGDGSLIRAGGEKNSLNANDGNRNTNRLAMRDEAQQLMSGGGSRMGWGNRGGISSNRLRGSDGNIKDGVRIFSESKPEARTGGDTPHTLSTPGFDVFGSDNKRGGGGANGGGKGGSVSGIHGGGRALRSGHSFQQSSVGVTHNAFPPSFPSSPRLDSFASSSHGLRFPARVPIGNSENSPLMANSRALRQLVGLKLADLMIPGIQAFDGASTDDTGDYVSLDGSSSNSSSSKSGGSTSSSSSASSDPSCCAAVRKLGAGTTFPAIWIQAQNATALTSASGSSGGRICVCTASESVSSSEQARLAADDLLPLSNFQAWRKKGGFDGLGLLKVRGSSSARQNEKKSWVLKLHKLSRSSNNNNSSSSSSSSSSSPKLKEAKAPLAGLPPASQWVMYGPEDDRTMGIRNVMAYGFARRMGRWAPRTRFVEVYLQQIQNGDQGGESSSLSAGDYHGLYVLTERIQRGKWRVNVSEMDFKSQSAGSGNDSSSSMPEDLSGGYILSYENDNVSPGQTVIRTPQVGLVMPIVYPNVKKMQQGVKSQSSSVNTYDSSDEEDNDNDDDGGDDDDNDNGGNDDENNNISDDINNHNISNAPVAVSKSSGSDEDSPAVTGDSGTKVVNWIQNYLGQIETALQVNQTTTVFQYPSATSSPSSASSKFGSGSDSSNPWNFLDLDAFIDYFLGTELTKNPDGYRGSVYMSKDKGKPLAFGPLWDYNEAFGVCCGYPILGYDRNGVSTGSSGGSAISPEGWRFNICDDPSRCVDDPIDGVSRYFRSAWQDPEFRKRVAARWRYLRGKSSGGNGTYESTATGTATSSTAAAAAAAGALSDTAVRQMVSGIISPLRPAALRNYQRWKSRLASPFFTGTSTTTAEEAQWTYEIRQLVEWIYQRLTWMDAALDDTANGGIGVTPNWTRTRTNAVTPTIRGGITASGGLGGVGEGSGSTANSGMGLFGLLGMRAGSGSSSSSAISTGSTMLGNGGVLGGLRLGSLRG